MKQKRSAVDLSEPFTLTCTRCGGEATAYPYPLPRGTVYCPVCSPAWVKPFIESVLAQKKQAAT